MSEQTKPLRQLLRELEARDGGSATEVVAQVVAALREVDRRLSALEQGASAPAQAERSDEPGARTASGGD
jgi:hypothetical protein